MNRRREFLKACAAVGVSAALPSSLNSQAAAPRRIDVHHHFRTPFVPDPGSGEWTPRMSLDQMDKFGIATAMLSHPGNGEQIYDGTEKGNCAGTQGE